MPQLQLAPLALERRTSTATATPGRRVRSRFARTLAIALTLGALSPSVASAEECNKAEHLRLSDESKKLAQRNAWSGVERAYESMLATKCELKFDEHDLGAQSARVLGKTWEMYERLTAAKNIDPKPEILDALKALDDGYGRVEIKGDARRRPTLTRAAMPFAPDQRKSIEWAQEVVLGTGSFKGMLPLGDFVIGETPFTATAGPDFQIVTVGKVKGGGSGGSAPVVQKEGLVNYAGPIATIGPNYLLTPEPKDPVTAADGLHQVAPSDVSATGVSVSLGGEIAFTYRQPEAGLAATVGYVGGYGNDTLHLLNGWLAGVLRPGQARIAVGPSYMLVTGKGTGAASWFDVGQDQDRNPNDALRYQGWSWGGGAQASVGYGVLDLDTLRGVVELHGGWHTDGARSFTGIGLRVGIIPAVPRFEG